jgi:tetratricopeptide (TPR) repeat protein/predicted nucleotidyltransferase
MKNVYILFVIVLFSTFFFSCKNSEKDNRQKDIELMTAQTLGLAYLEEFKLDEAENEFLKVIELTPNEKLGYANLGLTYLRKGEYEKAENRLLKAIKIDSKDADIRLLLATVYEMSGEREKAIGVLLKTLKFAPKHVKILYNLSELYSVNSDEESQKIRESYIHRLVKNTSANIVPHLNITELLIKNKEFDKAIEQLEIINKQFPEFPKEAIGYFDNTNSLLRKSEADKALIQFRIFHNYLKVTAPYQAGIKKLKGPGGSLIGTPIITYDLQTFSQDSEMESLLDVIKFTDVTASVGLDVISTFEESEYAKNIGVSHVEVADYDGDGDTDIYAGSFDAASKTYKHYLFNNDMARFVNVSEEVGLEHEGNESSATFVDYDNDGFLDLYIVKEDGDVLYNNVGKGVFDDVTSKTKIGLKNGGKKALFFDLDHDGDLDLFETSSNSNVVFRNNGDNTFIEKASELGLSGNGANFNDAAFGDYDDDGDIDLLVVGDKANNVLFSNQRQGKFKDITENSGITSTNNSSSVAVGDFNNDGFLDLFVASLNGENSTLYSNKGNGSFEIAKKTHKIFETLKGVSVFDVKFIDFDNDGFLDILIAGKSNKKEGRGLFLFHNERDGNFTNVSHLLPDTVTDGRQIKLFDYNDDGDLDIMVAGLNGGVFLLRNDGGSLNHYVNLKLVGLRAGSAKNNYYGIGAKVEIRAGDLYQTMVVTNPNVYFGLGNHSKVDIIRITWTNGVPQNIFLPDADQELVEEQILKGSCPFLYTWNGEKYVFAKDITWRSALGMPLGIMGGTTMHAFPDASDDYIKIPGDMLKLKNGMYSVKLTSELWETIYMDKIQLVVADHPDSVDVFVPEQFSLPPFPGLDLVEVINKKIPIAAVDSEGNNVLEFIEKKDDNYLHNFKPAKYQGITEMHELVLNPGELGKSNNLLLFLNGWIFPTDASINVALSQSDKLKVKPPVLQVINKKGEWETVINNLGFPMGKDKTVIADLSGKFLSDDYRVRIQTNMEIYWDYIFFSNTKQNATVNTTVLNPSSANLNYRGFSKSFRKGGRYGPHWFDYYDVDKNRKWLDLSGNYTRYGDVLPLLLESDNKYIISNAGDETSIEFNAGKLPKLKQGWRRDFFIHSVGWVKDGDINTALGSTVLPLPYHGMKSYPPSEKDIYPSDEELKKYQEQYNTREVSSNNYRNQLKK